MKILLCIIMVCLMSTIYAFDDRPINPLSTMGQWIQQTSYSDSAKTNTISTTHKENISSEEDKLLVAIAVLLVIGISILPGALREYK